ncbi:MAG: hypothetical protein FJ405_18210, partial [Verrucomicrobia bacterium]|nr:hypothetical protein [Verrucomicrobiota bacterium]
MNTCRCDVRGLLLITLFLWCFTEVSLAHPDKVEDRLLFHFATGAHPPVRSEWQDLTHKLTATLKGEPSLAAAGPAQAMMFNGYTDWLLLAPDLEAARPFLPKREFSISAWVVLEKTAGIGGILGFIQDNGN